MGDQSSDWSRQARLRQLAELEHQLTTRGHPSDEDARRNKEPEHHPTTRGHLSDKDARQNKDLEHFPTGSPVSTRSENALESCLSPNEADLRCRHAGLLDLLGRTEDAKQTYLGILADEPRHAPTLNALGALLHRTGYRRAARTVFAQFAACHPDCADARVNLGNALRLAGETEAARAEFGAALAVAPAHARAHQGYGDLLAEAGDQLGAWHHWRLGYAGHAMHGWVFRGERRPVRVLMPISVANGNIAARVFLDDTVFAVTTLAMEFFDPADELPPHDVVLNAIGDADLCRAALVAAEDVMARSAAPVINAPARVLGTGRAAMGEALAALDDVAVPRIVALPRAVLMGTDAAAALAQHGLYCPVLLRVPGFHTGQHFVKVEHALELAAAAASLPGETLLAIAFFAACGVDGKARKGRVMVLDGHLYPLHWAVSTDWKVHYFTSDMAACAAHREEEARFLADMRGFLGERAVRGLQAVAACLALDYGGIDFALLADGRIVVFEANATMAIVPPPDEERWRYRRPASDVALLAAQSLVIRRARKTVLDRN
jgi:tetratricopeptide (TPR) repeat protein